MENARCVICLAPFDSQAARGQLPCGHEWFCMTCIHHWAHVTNKCPLCGQRFRRVQEVVSRYATGLTLRVDDRDPAPEANPLQRAIERIACTLCRSVEDWDSMLLCDQCNRGAHVQCLKMRRIPRSALWFCDECLENMDLRTQVAQWNDMQRVGRRGKRTLLLRIAGLASAAVSVSAVIKRDTRRRTL